MQLLQRSPRSSSSIILMCYHGWQQLYYCSLHWPCPTLAMYGGALTMSCSISTTTAKPRQTVFFLYLSPSLYPFLSVLYPICTICSALCLQQKNTKKQCSPASCYQHRSALSHTIISSRNSTRIGIWVLARCMLHSCIKKVFNAWGFAQYQPRYVFLWSLRYFFP